MPVAAGPDKPSFAEGLRSLWANLRSPFSSGKKRRRDELDSHDTSLPTDQGVLNAAVSKMAIRASLPLGSRREQDHRGTASKPPGPTSSMQPSNGISAGTLASALPRPQAVVQGLTTSQQPEAFSRASPSSAQAQAASPMLLSGLPAQRPSQQEPYSIKKQFASYGQQYLAPSAIPPGLRAAPHQQQHDAQQRRVQGLQQQQQHQQQLTQQQVLQQHPQLPAQQHLAGNQAAFAVTLANQLTNGHVHPPRPFSFDPAPQQQSELQHRDGSASPVPITAWPPASSAHPRQSFGGAAAGMVAADAVSKRLAFTSTPAGTPMRFPSADAVNRFGPSTSHSVPTPASATHANGPANRLAQQLPHPQQQQQHQHHQGHANQQYQQVQEASRMQQQHHQVQEPSWTPQGLQRQQTPAVQPEQQQQRPELAWRQQGDWQHRKWQQAGHHHFMQAQAAQPVRQAGGGPVLARDKPRHETTAEELRQLVAQHRQQPLHITSSIKLPLRHTVIDLSTQHEQIDEGQQHINNLHERLKASLSKGQQYTDTARQLASRMWPKGGKSSAGAAAAGPSTAAADGATAAATASNARGQLGLPDPVMNRVLVSKSLASYDARREQTALLEAQLQAIGKTSGHQAQSASNRLSMPPPASAGVYDKLAAQRAAVFAVRRESAARIALLQQQQTEQLLQQQQLLMKPSHEGAAEPCAGEGGEAEEVSMLEDGDDGDEGESGEEDEYEGEEEGNEERPPPATNGNHSTSSRHRQAAAAVAAQLSDVALSSAGKTSASRSGSRSKIRRPGAAKAAGLSLVTVEGVGVLRPEVLATWERVFNGGSPSEILVDHKPSKLELPRSQLLCMASREWLNDEVINMYITLLQERDTRQRGGSTSTPRCHFFSSFFWNKLYKDAGAYGYANVRRWTMPARLKAAGQQSACVLDCDRIIMPIHCGVHWTAAIIDIQHKAVFYYDSLKGDDDMLLEMLARWVADEAKDKKKEVWDTSGWELGTPKNIPKQMNGCDCGMFSIKFADYLAQAKPFDWGQKDIERFRREVLHSIVTGGVD